MTDDSDYEPAIAETPVESGAESAPVVRRDSPAAAAEAEAKLGVAGDTEAVAEGGPRMPRQRSDKSRAMFRELVAKVQAGEVETDGDLEPMPHAPPQAAAAPAAPAPSIPPAPVTPPAVAAAAPTPVAPPPGLPPLPELPLPAVVVAPVAPDPKVVEREAQLTARETALAEREKLMPDRTALVERPAATFVAWLRDVHGISSDDELKTALSDFVTELSEQSLGVKLPDEVKASLESRKAVRSVRAYKQTLDRDKQALAAERQATEKQAAEARVEQERASADAAYVARIAELIAPAREQHKFLHDLEVTGGVPAQIIVYEVLREQQKLGHKPDLASAVEYANNYYKSQAEVVAKKAAHFQSLLAPATPAPAVAPAPVTTSPGGAPGPAPTTPKPPVAPEWDPSDLPMDRQQRRQASLAKLVAARKAASQRA